MISRALLVGYISALGLLSSTSYANDCSKAMALQSLFPDSQSLQALPVITGLQSLHQIGETFHRDVSNINFDASRSNLLRTKFLRDAQTLIDGAERVRGSETCQVFLERMEKEEALQLGLMINELMGSVDSIRVSLNDLVRAACL